MACGVDAKVAHGRTSETEIVCSPHHTNAALALSRHAGGPPSRSYLHNGCGCARHRHAPNLWRDRAADLQHRGLWRSSRQPDARDVLDSGCHRRCCRGGNGGRACCRAGAARRRISDGDDIAALERLPAAARGRGAAGVQRVRGLHGRERRGLGSVGCCAHAPRQQHGITRKSYGRRHGRHAGRPHVADDRRVGPVPEPAAAGDVGGAQRLRRRVPPSPPRLRGLRQRHDCGRAPRGQRGLDAAIPPLRQRGAGERYRVGLAGERRGCGLRRRGSAGAETMWRGS